MRQRQPNSNLFFFFTLQGMNNNYKSALDDIFDCLFCVIQMRVLID